MAQETQKSKKSTTVRIYRETKERLQKVAFKKTGKESRSVTEVELVSEAVALLCRREEKKLKAI
jgi:hypothetical protein